MLTATILETVGLDKILNYLEFVDKWELADYMYSQLLYTIEDLAEHLSETTRLCPMCGGDLIHWDNEFCYECAEHLYNHPNWREDSEW